jgi:hypothetical protein
MTFGEDGHSHARSKTSKNALSQRAPVTTWAGFTWVSTKKRKHDCGQCSRSSSAAWTGIIAYARRSRRTKPESS